MVDELRVGSTVLGISVPCRQLLFARVVDVETGAGINSIMPVIYAGVSAISSSMWYQVLSIVMPGKSKYQY